MSKKIFKISKWIHKYVGLILLLFISWMSVSGVLLNHPDIFRNISVSKAFVPKAYHPKNWNRSSLKGLVYDKKDKNQFYLYGRQGIFLTKDNGRTFTPFMDGRYPKQAWGKRTNHIYIDKEKDLFLAATNKGLYRFINKKNEWKKVDLPSGNNPIKKILKMEASLLLISSSGLLVSHYDKLDFSLQLPPKASKKDKRISLVSIFLKLHDGSILGKFGIILWDIIGIIFLFLAISAFYIWYYPKKWKRNYKRNQKRATKNEKKKRSFHLRYHRKLGWYTAVFLIVITVTGMFLRPPLIIFLAGKSISAKYYPLLKNKNPWHKKISNGLYDSYNNRIVLETSDGFYTGNLLNKDTFKIIKLPVRIFAMGTTVFEEEKPGTAVIGSFGGLQRLDLTANKATNILKAKPSKNKGRPLSTLVTGYFKTPDSKEYILGHYKGICNTQGEPVDNLFNMPKTIKKKYKMPFWNLMFELHNARIFKGLIGGFYILIIPLSGLLILLILFSGIYDYLYKIKRKI